MIADAALVVLVVNLDLLVLSMTLPRACLTRSSIWTTTVLSILSLTTAATTLRSPRAVSATRLTSAGAQLLPAHARWCRSAMRRGLHATVIPEVANGSVRNAG